MKYILTLILLFSSSALFSQNQNIGAPQVDLINLGGLVPSRLTFPLTAPVTAKRRTGSIYFDNSAKNLFIYDGSTYIGLSGITSLNTLTAKTQTIQVKDGRFKGVQSSGTDHAMVIPSLNKGILNFSQGRSINALNHEDQILPMYNLTSSATFIGDSIFDMRDIDLVDKEIVQLEISFNLNTNVIGTNNVDIYVKIGNSLQHISTVPITAGNDGFHGVIKVHIHGVNYTTNTASSNVYGAFYPYSSAILATHSRGTSFTLGSMNILTNNGTRKQVKVVPYFSIIEAGSTGGGHPTGSVVTVTDVITKINYLTY